jgi:hypothetical protein
LAVIIEIAGTCVVLVGVLPRLSILDLVVAASAPTVKLISARRRVDLVLRIISTMDLNDLAGFHLGAALVRQDLRFSLAHDQ